MLPDPSGLTISEPARDSILRTVAYFDIFQYPLNQEEIRQFLERRIDNSLLEKRLQAMVEEGSLFLYQGFYMIQDNPLLVPRRRQGNERAEQLLVKARAIGRFLYSFPFVRGIGISGSLSKHFADREADIDFFIITSAKRLWLARTFMHIFKKLTFLSGRQHYYCMNYYVDEEAMLLDNQNIFTAVELKTLIPVSGQNVMTRFFSTNQWADQWLPQCPCRQQLQADPPVSMFRRAMEWMLSNRLGDLLDDLLWKTTTKRWKRKEAIGRRNNKGLMMGLITGKHFARSNPGDFQEKVLEKYEKRVREIYTKKGF